MPIAGTRSRGRELVEGPPPRVLVAEVAGFAASDADIAELVERLSNRAPFAAVNLDFSRTRGLRGRSAREFRLSFKIDLEKPYTFVSAPIAGHEAMSEGGVAHGGD